jgi:hypothetical protein
MVGDVDGRQLLRPGDRILVLDAHARRFRGVVHVISPTSTALGRQGCCGILFPREQREGPDATTAPVSTGDRDHRTLSAVDSKQRPARKFGASDRRVDVVTARARRLPALMCGIDGCRLSKATWTCASGAKDLPVQGKILGTLVIPADCFWPIGYV